MPNKCILILFLFFSTITQSQILEINKPLFSDNPFFNTTFIRANKVASITGSRSSKRVNDIIRQKGLDYQYQFNLDGTLKKQLSTFYLQKNRKDTSVTSYQYDKNKTLISKRKSDGNGFYSYQYEFDNKGNIIKQTYSRDENANSSKGNFKLNKQYIIRVDSFSYQNLSDQQVKKIFYNSYGKSYKEQISYYNSYSYLIEEYSKFIIGGKKSRKTYEYDEKGRVSKTIDFHKNKEVAKVYFYDEIGNVLEIKTYHNEEYITSQQYLYDPKTMLLTAQLTKEIETEFIRIIKYSYTFFD